MPCSKSKLSTNFRHKDDVTKPALFSWHLNVLSGPRLTPPLQYTDLNAMRQTIGVNEACKQGDSP